MRRPGGALSGLFVDKYSNARWGKRCLVEIKQSVELGPGGELWMEAGASQ